MKRYIAVLLPDPRLHDEVVPDGVWDEDDLETIMKLKEALACLQGFEFSYHDDHGRFIQDLQAGAGHIDLAVNFCDTGYFNDFRKELHVTALLEIFNIPYTGASPKCQAFCLDKALVKAVATDMGIPVARGIMVEPSGEIPRIEQFPVIVKPNSSDGGQGITARSVCYAQGEVVDVINSLREKICKHHPILIEEFLPGKDLTIGVLGNPGYPTFTMLPVMEEDYSNLPSTYPRICGYEAKWDPTSPYWGQKSLAAILSPDVDRTVKEWTRRLFVRLDCHDYARFDWRLDSNGIPRLLEANPNPGWVFDGHLANASASIGI
nr:D-alanine--D-alanine ligase [Candidatus Sigynarchaeota archaeon]